MKNKVFKDWICSCTYLGDKPKKRWGYYLTYIPWRISVRIAQFRGKLPNNYKLAGWYCAMLYIYIQHYK